MWRSDVIHPHRIGPRRRPAIKTVVLDTSGLVADPGGLTEFAGPALWVRPTLVEELDNLKNRPDATGRTAPGALRRLEANNAMSVLTTARGGGRGGRLFGPIRVCQGGRSPLATVAPNLL